MPYRFWGLLDSCLAAKVPQLEIDIVALAEPESQIDPKFQTAFKYTRITAKAMREALGMKIK